MGCKSKPCKTKKSDKSLRMYTMTIDSGFAPYVKDGWISLACCAPFTRRKANVGDFVLGVSGKTMKKVNQHTLIYLMKVDEKLTFNEYFYDSRFLNRSDNIYRKRKRDDKYIQDRRHVKDKRYMSEHKGKDDTRISKKVILSGNFYYFGDRWRSDGKLHKRMEKFCEKVKYDYKPYGQCEDISSDNGDVKKLLRFIKKYPLGKNGKPNHLPDNNQKQRCHKH